MKYFLLFSTLLFGIASKAQKSEKLRVGERIPVSKITVLNQDNKMVNIDLPNGKTVTDRFVLVYFYDRSTSVKELIAFNNDIERVLNKYQNNACKGASEIEYVTVCTGKEYDLWKNKLEETHYNKSKFTGKKTNYLAQNGLKDKSLQAFKVTKFPSLFLVNPLGKLYLETDSIEVLEKTFKNICRNSSSYTADITGKLLTGDKNKLPLMEHHVYLMKGINDTLNTASTDKYGDFIFKQIDTTQTLSLQVEQNAKLKSQKVYLAKQNGELVAEIKKTKSGVFEYKLLDVDVQKLTEIEEDEDITLKYKKFNLTSQKDFIVNENVYYDLAKFTILTENEIVLDKVIVILNANPSVTLQVISHTDAQGDDAANLKLSENRSASVIDYLVSKGIDKKRLKGIGKGETEIRNRCVNGVSCSDKEHEYNRRTQFKFIKN